MDTFPAIHAEVFHTPNGTSYLRQPGVVILAVPDTRLDNLDGFLKGFDESFHFSDYLNDPTSLGPVERLCKLAGQLCYMSFGPKRTLNAEAEKYFFNIKSSGHGSVLEHANVSLLLYGVSRSLTHELVRHRAGFGFSQVSQRYVSGRTLRFVERPEFVGDTQMHAMFESRIDRAANEYESLSSHLEELQAAGQTAILTGEQKTDLRKKVRQVARAVLPNETEAPIVVTANMRAWRHFIEMRASNHSETEIRAAAFRIFTCLKQIAPIMFGDYREEHFTDNTTGVSTEYRKT
jgi:thymidylate synthase (FAD)